MARKPPRCSTRRGGFLFRETFYFRISSITGISQPCSGRSTGSSSVSAFSGVPLFRLSPRDSAHADLAAVGQKLRIPDLAAQTVQMNMLEAGQAKQCE